MPKKLSKQLQTRIDRAITDANAVQQWAGRADELVTLPEVNMIAEVERQATGLCEQWARVASILRTQQKNQSAGALVKRVRKALGYTYP